jgi:hypothetical protein
MKYEIDHKTRQVFIDYIIQSNIPSKDGFQLVQLLQTLKPITEAKPVVAPVNKGSLETAGSL